MASHPPTRTTANTHRCCNTRRGLSYRFLHFVAVAVCLGRSVAVAALYGAERVAVEPRVAGIMEVPATLMTLVARML